MLLAGAGLVTAGCAAPSTTQPATEAEVTSTTPTPTATQTPTSRWRAGKIAPAAPLAAYANDSVQSGQPLQLHVSAAAPGKRASTGSAFWRQGRQRKWPRPAATSACSPASRSIRRPGLSPLAGRSSPRSTRPDGPRGLYTVVVRTSDGGTNIPFVVRRLPPKGRWPSSQASMTWQAYNIWGGASLTRIPPVISVAGTRSPTTALTTTHCGAHRSPWDSTFRWPGSPTRWASITWFSNADIARDPGLLKGAVGVVSTGHDEYWPQSPAGAARRPGLRLGPAFLGANAGYWRVGLKGDEVYCAKDAAVQPKNIRWRDLGKPESAVVGVLYDAFPVAGPMVVRQPDFVLFDGIRTKAGPNIPAWSASSPTGTTRAIRPRRISRCRRCRRSPAAEGTWSTMSYYSVGSGANVFATGTMNWTRSLNGPSVKKDHRSIRGFQPRSHRQSAGRAWPTVRCRLPPAMCPNCLTTTRPGGRLPYAQPRGAGGRRRAVRSAPRAGG